MLSRKPELIQPPQTDREFYTYRPVWNSTILQVIIVGGMTLTLMLTWSTVRQLLPEISFQIINLGFALVPSIVWLWSALYRESQFQEPRQRLLVVALGSALAASAIGIPLKDIFFRVDNWLPLSSAIDRIIGYTCTVAVVQEFFKYIVIRVLIWPDLLRVRADAIAYAESSAVGYATALNLSYISLVSASPDAAALRTFSHIVLNLTGSLIVAYGFSELRFSQSLSVVMPAAFLAACVVNGAAIPLRAGLISASLGFADIGPRPLLAFVFVGAIQVVAIATVQFLFSNAERRALESSTEG